MKGSVFQPRLESDGVMYCDSTWYQGKGVYGGLVFSYFVQGFIEHGRFPIRSIQVELCRPMQEGEAKFQFFLMCRGSRTEFWRAEVYQNTSLVAYANAVLGTERKTDYGVQELVFPAVPPWQKVTPIPRNPIMPSFSQHLEYRVCLGGFPFQGSSCSQTGGWISFREDQCAHPAVQQAALIDSWWPSMAMNMKKMHYMGTVSFSCHFFEPVAPPYLFVGQNRVIREGYASEKNELWSADGRIVALAQQLIAIIR